MSTDAAFDALLAKVRSLLQSSTVSAEPRHNHIGAVLADAVLQSGVNYEHVVKPRVERIRSEERAATICGLQMLMAEQDACDFLQNRNQRKANAFCQVVELLAAESVETEAGLAEWLDTPGAATKLLSIKGIGPKTADYLRLLVGLPAIAIDRQLWGFLEEAGYPNLGYYEAQKLLADVADQVGVDQAVLDQAIWAEMSRRRA